MCIYNDILLFSNIIGNIVEVVFFIFFLLAKEEFCLIDNLICVFLLGVYASCTFCLRFAKVYILLCLIYANDFLKIDVYNIQDLHCLYSQQLED